MRIDPALIATLGFCALPLCAQNTWKVQFFHDQDTSAFEIHDLKCPSARTCVAAGGLAERGKDKLKGAVVRTADGGAHWAYIDVKEVPYSLFFLNSSIGWMAADHGIWRTDEGGASWRKLKGLRGIERLWFLDESHGWAVGELKALYETTDGGKEWVKRMPTDVTPTAPQDTVYDWVAFDGPERGVIAGSWNPSHAAQELAWTDPSSKRPHGPMAAILIETNDGGKHWSETQIKVTGQLTRIQFLKYPDVLGLVEFVDGTHARPSEIFRINLKTRGAPPVFLQDGRVARDVAVLPSGEVIVAAVELMGKMADIPIPGKLRMMQSTSLNSWLNERADYRAVARQPIIAAADSNNVWVATDTGMILKRVPGPAK